MTTAAKPTNAIRAAVCREIYVLRDNGNRELPFEPVFDTYWELAKTTPDPPITAADISDDVRLAVLEGLLEQHPDELRRGEFIYQRVVREITETRARLGL